MDPARCRRHLSQGERVHRCGLGGPGLSLDTLLQVKLFEIQLANDCTGLVVGKEGRVGFVAPIARAKGVPVRSLPQMLRDTGGAWFQAIKPGWDWSAVFSGDSVVVPRSLASLGLVPLQFQLHFRQQYYPIVVVGIAFVTPLVPIPPLGATIFDFNPLAVAGFPTDPTGCRMHLLGTLLIQPMQRLSQWNFALRCWMKSRIARSRRTHQYFGSTNFVLISRLTSSVLSEARLSNWAILWRVRYFLFLHIMLALSHVRSHRSCWKSSEDPSCFGTVPWRFWPKPSWKNQQLPTSQKSDILSFGGKLAWEWFGVARTRFFDEL